MADPHTDKKMPVSWGAERPLQAMTFVAYTWEVRKKVSVGTSLIGDLASSHDNMLAAGKDASPYHLRQHSDEEKNDRAGDVPYLAPDCSRRKTIDPLPEGALLEMNPFLE